MKLKRPQHKLSVQKSIEKKSLDLKEAYVMLVGEVDYVEPGVEIDSDDLSNFLIRMKLHLKVISEMMRLFVHLCSLKLK